MIYESYTSHLALSRMEREITLLEHLVELSNENEIEISSSLQEAYNRLALDLENLVKKRGLQTGSGILAAFPEWTQKTMYAALPWLLLGFILFVASESGQERGTMLGGIVATAVPFIILGAMLPRFDQDWINWLHPWLTISAVIVLILIWNRRRNES